MGERDPDFPPIGEIEQLPGVDPMDVDPLRFGPPGRFVDPRDPGGHDHPRVTDVTTFGAGQGGDDTELIQRAIDHSPDGGVIYFPAGTYRIGRPAGSDFERIRVVARRCLTFVGEGRCSILRRRRGNPLDRRVNAFVEILGDDVLGMFDCIGCSQIEFSSLRFDANGLESGELVRFSGSRGVRIRGVRFSDPNARATLPAFPALNPERGVPFFESLRLAVLFRLRTEILEDAEQEATAPISNEDIWIEGNELSGLGVCIRHANRVWVVGNSFVRPRMHGILIGASTNGEHHRDIQVLDNTIWQPQTHAIVCADLTPDQLQFAGNQMVRIRIAGNTIRKRASETPTGNFGFGILVGPRSALVDATVQDSTYRNIVVEQNLVHFTRALGVPTGRPDDEVGGIRLNMPSGGRFEAPIVRDNTVIGYRAAGIRVDRPRGGVVMGNSVYDGTEGISLQRGIRFSHVASNRVLVSEVGFRFEGSRGQNVFADNTVLGAPSTVLSTDDVEDTDIVDTPRTTEGGGDDFFEELIFPDIPDVFD